MEAESKNEIKEAASEFFGWDKRIINTVRDMLNRPGEAVLESLENPHKSKTQDQPEERAFKILQHREKKWSIARNFLSGQTPTFSPRKLKKVPAY